MPAIKQLFNDFSLGQMDKINPENIPENALQRACNVDTNTEGQLATRLGVRRKNTGVTVLDHADEFNDAYWTKTFVTVTADDKPNPLVGSSTADKLENNSAAAIGSVKSVYANVDAFVGDSDLWTFSIWVRTPVEIGPGGEYPAFVLSLEFGISPVTTLQGGIVIFGLHPNANQWAINQVNLPNIQVESFIGTSVEASDGAIWYNLIVTAAPTNVSVSHARFGIQIGNYQVTQDPLDPEVTVISVMNITELPWIHAWNAKAYPGRFIQEDSLQLYSPAKWILTGTMDVSQQLGDCTSIVQYVKANETREIVATFERGDPSVLNAGDAAYQEIHIYDEANDRFDLVVPSSTANATGNTHRFQWVNFNDLLIGVNRVSTAENAAIGGFNIYNPIKKTALGASAGNVAALGGSPPRGRFIEVFKSRIWIVDEDSPDTLYCSALGDAEDYTTTGIAGSQSFQFYDAKGSTIKGIKAAKTPEGTDVLLVFLDSAIYYMRPGSPDTDISQYEQKQLSAETGCVSAYTIQEILDDTVFLSRYGILPISALFTSRDLENTSLSKNISDFDNLNVNTENHHAIIDVKTSRYIISIATGSSAEPNRTWVFDFSKVKEGLIASFEYSGAWIASAFGNVVELGTGRKRIAIGGFADPATNDQAPFYYGDEPGRYHDAFEPIETLVITKRFGFQNITDLLHFIRIYAAFRLLTSTINPIISIRIDGSESNFGNYPVSFSADVVSGGKWGSAIWDTDVWAFVLDVIKRWQKKLVASLTGLVLRGRTIELSIRTEDEISGYILHAIGFKANKLGDYRW